MFPDRMTGEGGSTTPEGPGSFQGVRAYWRKFSTRRNDRIRIRSDCLFLDFSQLSFKYPLNNAILWGEMLCNQNNLRTFAPS